MRVVRVELADAHRELLEIIVKKGSGWRTSDFTARRRTYDVRSGGAPSKLSDEHRARLKAWIDAEPLTCRVLVDHLETECGIRLSANTLRNDLKCMGYVWKRTRYSLKKARPQLSQLSGVFIDGEK